MERAAIGCLRGLEKLPKGIERGTPNLGEHESYVLGELLGTGRAEYEILGAKMLFTSALYLFVFT